MGPAMRQVPEEGHLDAHKAWDFKKMGLGPLKENMLKSFHNDFWEMVFHLNKPSFRRQW